MSKDNFGYNEVKEKKCSRCGVEKSIEKFYKKKVKKGKVIFHSYCKPCMSLYEKQDRKAYQYTGIMVDEKLCKKCNTTKPLGEFSRDRTRKYGRKLVCKTCTNKALQLRTPHNYKETTATEKACTNCGLIKPLIDFHLYKWGEHGRKPRCKICRIEIQKQQRIKRNNKA